jgi:far upstream element-binding protein
MQTNTGCKINVAQPSGRDIEREIGLVGSRNAIAAAKRAIMEKVEAVVSLRHYIMIVYHLTEF